MFTEKDREELIRIFQKLAPETTKTLEQETLPSSITHNGENTGITINFRKLSQNTSESKPYAHK